MGGKHGCAVFFRKTLRILYGESRRVEKKVFLFAYDVILLVKNELVSENVLPVFIKDTERAVFVIEFLCRFKRRKQADNMHVLRSRQFNSRNRNNTVTLCRRKERAAVFCAVVVCQRNDTETVYCRHSRNVARGHIVIGARGKT